MRSIFKLLLVSSLFSLSIARADLLPDVENIQLNGQVLSWAAQDGATGYNILIGYRYYDTVKNGLRYTVTEPGKYTVVAFNDAGDFGSDYTSERLEFDAVTSKESVDYTFLYNVLLVYKTCKDVGPGESCIAYCPERYTEEFSPVSTSTATIDYMSGGGCSTSDIVEADAFVAHMSYKCTVPTYSGEVVAQAICPLR